MIKVEYNKPRPVLGELYVRSFGHELKALRKGWRRLRKSLVAISSNPQLYPEMIDDILKMDFVGLNDIFEDYRYLNSRGLISRDLEASLKRLFCYDAQTVKRHACLHKDGKHLQPNGKLWKHHGLQPLISLFFSNPNNGFKIHTCHYCDTAYINVFGFKSIYRNTLELVNNADDEDLREYIVKSDGNEYNDKTYVSIKAKRQFTSIKDFDSLSVWKRGNRTTPKSISIERSSHNQYDLDHVLPKGKCPIVGLSLFNFVPSCQVCNEKLKREEELGSDKTERILLSPTVDSYNFEGDFEIENLATAVPKLGYLEHADDYRIVINPKNPTYQKHVKLFHLRERYNYHKAEALRLRDLLEDYSEGNIDMICRAFSDAGLGSLYTKEKIEEDLFGESFYKEHHRTFSKMRLDIINQFKTES